ncbi:protein mono-ADP-ribosyltransferase PARP9-like isoform X2 [Ambystoma mexicanum]|uniref:protein mono-ADP-ribosyltransferase PARP9-like isoform X2 n=1 Tax=Ambystoma mexicanum TaxID=8296 RepID=UPI0037E8D98C
MPNGKTISIPLEDAVCAALTEINILSDILGMKFDCEATLKNAHLNARSRHVGAEKVYEQPLGNGGKIRLSVWRDDLTRHHVDAIVNAANEDLEHIGGLALNILKAGGKQIEKESKDIINKQGKVKTGTIAQTSGGDLPCKVVIHAVGPRCQGKNHQDHGRCIQLLHMAIQSILSFVNNERSHVKSVAIPALSSGIFGFPLEHCAERIVTTIYGFCSNYPLNPQLQEIRLVNNDWKTVNAMKKACEMIIGSSNSNLFTGNRTQSLSSESRNAITIHGIDLKLLKGYIEDQKVSVIVNSVDESLDLSRGLISKAILSKAGPRIQEEILEKRTKREPRASQILKTKGYKLPCDYVYHTTLPLAERPDSEKVLKALVSDCLENARKQSFPQICFPAIGTGNLGFSKQKVARLMVREVIHFAEQHPQIKMGVHFVIYPTDSESLKAFEDEFQSCNVLLMSDTSVDTSHGRAEGAGFIKGMIASMTQLSPWSENRDRRKQSEKTFNAPLSLLSTNSDFQTNNFTSERMEHEPEKPTIEIVGKNDILVQEAALWIQRILQPHMDNLLIENNHIFYCGVHEHKLISNLDTNVSITENLKNGSAHIIINGLGHDVIKAGLKIERLLCDVQKEYELEQEEELSAITGLLNGQNGKTTQIDQTVPDVCEIKSSIDCSTQLYKDKTNEFQKENLRIVKMEKIQNPILKVIYQSKRDCVEKKKIVPPCHQLYHRVPAQFCNSVCRLGFQRKYAYPAEQTYGAGIYFSKSIKGLDVKSAQKSTTDRYIYIFQAEVVTGNTTKGKEFYIMPPPIGSDCMDMYDSVVDYISIPETFVIFNSSQALPQFLFTCEISEKSYI